MLRFLVRLVFAGWIAVLAAAWWLAPLAPRYEVPASTAWVHLSDDGQTLLVGELRTPPRQQEDTRTVDAHDLAQRALDEALAGPPPGSTLELAVYDASSGQLQRRFEAPPGYRLVGSGNGSLVAAARSAGEIRLWDTRTGTQVTTLALAPFNELVEAPPLALSADGQRMAYAAPHPNPPEGVPSWDTLAVIRVWNANAVDEVVTLVDARPPVALSSDGKLLATSGDDQAARIWNAENGKLLATYAPHTFRVSALAFSPDGRRLASAANGATPTNAQSDRRPTEIKLYDIGASKEIGAIDVPAMGVGRLSFDPSGKLLMADGTLLGRMTWHVGKFPPRPLPTALQAGATSADGAWLAVTQGESVSLPLLPMLNNQFVRVVDTATGETRVDLRLALPPDDEINSQIQPLAFTPDGRMLAIHVTQRDTLWRQLSTGRYADIFPREGRLNICGELWGVDLETQRVKFRLPSQTFSVGAEARFADNGRLLLSRVQHGPGGQQITLAAWNIPPRRSLWAIGLLGLLTAATAAWPCKRLWGNRRSTSSGRAS